MDIREQSNIVQTTLVSRIDALDKQLDEVEKKFDRLILIIDKIQEKISELIIKDIARRE